MELDAKVIVELLNGAECPNQSYSLLLNDCRSLIARLLQVRVGHVYREANQCADLLAKRGCSMMENFAVFDFPPSADMLILIKMGCTIIGMLPILWPLWVVCNVCCWLLI